MKRKGRRLTAGALGERALPWGEWRKKMTTAVLGLWIIHPAVMIAKFESGLSKIEMGIA